MIKPSILILLFGIFSQSWAQLAVLKGVVKDSKTGESISGAHINIVHLPLHDSTRSDGQFEIKQAPQGEMELLVQKQGYAFVKLKVNVKAKAAYLEVKLEKQLVPELAPLEKELNKYREKVAVVTDKPYYYPGEIIWLKAFIDYFDIKRKDSLSRVVYIEMINANSIVIKRKVLSLDSGKLAGNIVLPDELTPGSYVLRAYTRFMRNFGERYFFTKAIPVLPPTARVVSTRVAKKTNPNAEIISDKEMYGLREPIKLKINNVPEGEYSISVTDSNQVVPIQETRLSDVWGFSPQIVHEQLESVEYNVEKGVRFVGRFVSEYNTGKQVTLVLFREGMTETIEFLTDPKGWFQVNGVKFYDSMTYFYKAKIGKKGREFFGRVQVSAEDEIKSSLVIPGFWFNTQMVDNPQRSLADYLAPPETKVLQEVTVRGQRIENERAKGIRGGSDNVIKAESLQNFGNLLLSLQGKIPGLIINCATTPCTVRLSRSTGTTIMGSTEPLVLIDDVPAGQSAGNTLQNIDVNMVDRIEVSRRINVLYGEQGRNGIIAVYLKDGLDLYTDPNTITQSFEIRGFDRPLAFVSPNYAQGNQERSFSDFRSTIYWNPSVHRDVATKEYSCSFYSSDLPGQYRVVFQGITKEGKPLYAESIIEVQDN